MHDSNRSHTVATLRLFDTPDANQVRRLVSSVLEEFGFAYDCHGDDSDVEDVSRYYEPPSNTFLILELDGVVMGTVGVKQRSDAVAELRRMYLEPELRGRGMGKRLLESALHFCESRNYEKIFLQTSEKFEHAIRLYEGFGFSRTGTCANRCELTYEKTLPVP